MPTYINYDEPKYAESARRILQRHSSNANETNITSAVRDFLIETGLADKEDIHEEIPPGVGSRQAVDLATLHTLIEIKRRIGASIIEPTPEYIQQLDDYLEQSAADGGRGVRMGVLTDGKHWLLRWTGAGEVRTSPPYAFTLADEEESWIPLYEWLRDEALASYVELDPTRANIERHFGPHSPRYEQDIAILRRLYDASSDSETIIVKRRLWYDLLRAALGEITFDSEDAIDNMFVRHTYLSMVIGMVVQATFGLDIRQIAQADPTDLLLGRHLRTQTGLQGIVESDFFAWPSEIGGVEAIRSIARRVSKFRWSDAPADIGATLYESVIPADERRQLGEYYTPDWLARVMVREVITDPLNQRALDPACGSGAFIAEAVTHFIEAANTAKPTDTYIHPKEMLDKLRESVIGIDVHPVAVHLARAAWALAARPLIEDTIKAGFNASLSIPVYLGDSLQLHYRTGDMFAQHQVTIQVGDEANSELVFPISLVDRSEDFDSLMGDVSEYLENAQDPLYALNDNGITDPNERKILEQTIKTLGRLHEQGQDHIWAYYTRNSVRPVALSRNKVDVIIGNPPWLNYNQTVSTLRAELRQQSENRYDIWTGGRYATHQDVAGLFFAHCSYLYLREGGFIGMVMPHSALQAGQYSKWRTGQWPPKAWPGSPKMNFGWKTAWDLEGLEPNTFFPVPACVVFARRVGAEDSATPLAGSVERWLGAPGASADRTARFAITDTSADAVSPYAKRARQGATIVPRCLFFVNEVENPAIIQAAQTVNVVPRRGVHDKRPWKELDLSSISGQSIETTHLYEVHLGETVVPYTTLDPLKAILPIARDERIPPPPPPPHEGRKQRHWWHRSRQTRTPHAHAMAESQQVLGGEQSPR